MRRLAPSEQLMVAGEPRPDERTGAMQVRSRHHWVGACESQASVEIATVCV
jgi:hypothetical protein